MLNGVFTLICSEIHISVNFHEYVYHKWIKNYGLFSISPFFLSLYIPSVISMSVSCTITSMFTNFLRQLQRLCIACCIGLSKWMNYKETIEQKNYTIDIVTFMWMWKILAILVAALGSVPIGQIVLVHVFTTITMFIMFIMFTIKNPMSLVKTWSPNN